MKVGFAWREITPALERAVYLAGFGRNRRAQFVHDPLTARAAAVQVEDDGQDRQIISIIAVDLIGLIFLLGVMRS